jgi:hypothetical protein
VDKSSNYFSLLFPINALLEELSLIFPCFLYNFCHHIVNLKKVFFFVCLIFLCCCSLSTLACGLDRDRVLLSSVASSQGRACSRGGSRGANKATSGQGGAWNVEVWAWVESQTLWPGLVPQWTQFPCLQRGENHPLFWRLRGLTNEIALHGVCHRLDPWNKHCPLLAL